VGGDN